MGNKNIIERFIWFDDKVRAKKYPNATRLSEQFEISLKTAQRDIEFMRDRLDYPLLYDESKKGYYYKDNTFSLPMTYLSSEELTSLLIARKLLQDISGGIIGDEIKSVVNKITAILKRHIAETDTIDNTLSFELIEYSPAPEKIFRTVLEGCLKRRSLALLYHSPAYEEKTWRIVDPYHLMNYMGTWHLIAYCHRRKGIRNFLISRISELNITDDTFAIRKNFNIKKHLHSTFGLYKGKPLVQVTIRFSPEKSKWFKGQIWHKDQKERILKGGSLELSFPVARLDEIKREILKHGADVEVIKPKGLRELIKAEAKKIAKIY